MLSAADLEAYNRQGFLIVPHFASDEELADLRTRAEQIVSAFDASKVSVFSTRNQKQKTDEYFLESASAVHCFFEEKAFDDSGQLRQPKALSINKIGHALHDLDPIFRRFTRSAKAAKLLQELGLRQPIPVQSMYIFKQPKIGGEVIPHQDTTFLHTEPPSVVGLWLALEDATIHNGCLWSLPGSHTHPVKRQFVRDADGSMTFTGEYPLSEWPLDKFAPLEVPAGTLVILHGANVHFSKENSSAHSRHAFSVHFVEGAAGYTWPATNWLQRDPAMPFKPLSNNEP